MYLQTYSCVYRSTDDGGDSAHARSCCVRIWRDSHRGRKMRASRFYRTMDRKRWLLQTDSVEIIKYLEKLGIGNRARRIRSGSSAALIRRRP